MKIILADDDDSIQSAVRRIVTDAGYEFVGVKDGAQLVGWLKDNHADLILLDIMMPKMDGFAACAKLREAGCETPLIFLSAKGDVVDKGVGFRLGGDDYLVKPFIPEELAMRIDALLRREIRARNRHATSTISYRGIQIDNVHHKVLVDGQSVELTQKEYQILFLLASNIGEVFTRERIIEEVWGKEYIEGSSSVAVFIRRIREKIEKNPSKPEYLLTVYHVGYKFGEEP